MTGLLPEIVLAVPTCLLVAMSRGVEGQAGRGQGAAGVALGLECWCRRHRDAIDWIIVGGESGHNARPFDLAWARSLRDQCAAAKVPCFVKQMGAHCVDGDHLFRDRAGADPDEWPEDLRVRQVPGVQL